MNNDYRMMSIVICHLLRIPQVQLSQIQLSPCMENFIKCLSTDDYDFYVENHLAILSNDKRKCFIRNCSEKRTEVPDKYKNRYSACMKQFGDFTGWTKRLLQPPLLHLSRHYRAFLDVVDADIRRETPRNQTPRTREVYLHEKYDDMDSRIEKRNGGILRFFRNMLVHYRDCSQVSMNADGMELALMEVFSQEILRFQFCLHTENFLLRFMLGE
ncbi:hypothetical protein ACS0TY_031822 [Phlomoides rotata]